MDCLMCDDQTVRPGRRLVPRLETVILRRSAVVVFGLPVASPRPLGFSPPPPHLRRLSRRGPTAGADSAARQRTLVVASKSSWPSRLPVGFSSPALCALTLPGNPADSQPWIKVADLPDLLTAACVLASLRAVESTSVQFKTVCGSRTA